MKLLVTHHAPDLDAIGSVWMLKTFDPQHFADAKVAFVDPGSTISDGELQELGFKRDDFDDIVHTDTGLGEFDHHQPERGMLHISATSLTFEHVCKVHPHLASDWALQEVVRIITDIDHFEECFWPDANDAMYTFMLHDILDGLQKAGLHTDETQLHFGMTALNGIYKKLEETVKAREVLADAIEFETKWGKGVAIETRNDTVIKYAQKAGYVIVIKKDSEDGTVRIKAIPKKGIDLTPLAEAVKAKDTVGTWYFHPSRTMLLNGSDKSRAKKPSPLTLKEVMDLIEDVL